MANRVKQYLCVPDNWKKVKHLRGLIFMGPNISNFCKTHTKILNIYDMHP